MSVLRLPEKAGYLDWVSWSGYTYSWFGNHKWHFVLVTVAVADRLILTVTAFTHVNECIMRLSIIPENHLYSECYFSGSLYPPTGVSGFSVKEAFDAQFQIVLHSVHVGGELVSQAGYLDPPG